MPKKIKPRGKPVSTPAQSQRRRSDADHAEHGSPRAAPVREVVRANPQRAARSPVQPSRQVQSVRSRHNAGERGVGKRANPSSTEEETASARLGGEHHMEEEEFQPVKRPTKRRRDMPSHQERVGHLDSPARDGEVEGRRTARNPSGRARGESVAPAHGEDAELAPSRNNSSAPSIKSGPNLQAVPPGSSLRAVLSSHEQLRAVIVASQGDVEKKLESFGKKLEALEESVYTCVRFLANKSSEKDVRGKINVALAPLGNIFSGTFYHRIFGMVFITTAMKGAVSSDTGNDPSTDLVGIRNVLHALVFRRLVTEETTEKLRRSKTHTEACRFRVELSWKMMSVAHANDSIGTTPSYEGGNVVKIPRPTWLSKHRVTREVIKEAILHDSKTTKQKTERPSSAKKTKEPVMTGTLYEDAIERALYAEEVAKRLNQRHVQQLNKCRETVRADFFNRLGFLWHPHVRPGIQAFESQTFTSDIQSVPLTTKALDASHSKEIKENENLYAALREENSASMCFTVTYNVEVVDKKTSSDAAPRSTSLTREIDLIQVALSFCTRFTMCQKADDYLNLHRNSLKVVYAIAGVFREMVVDLVDNERCLPQDDNERLEEGNHRSIETLVYDLIPTLNKTQTSILEQSVLRLTAQEFEELHCDTIGGNSNDNDSEMFMSGDYGEVDSEEEDEEFRDLREYNFA